LEGNVVKTWSYHLQESSIKECTEFYLHSRYMRLCCRA
jgi:hypothetical protein